MAKRYQYTISDCADVELFGRQCAALERRIPELRKAALKEDVDGSSYQEYRHELGEIVVANDCYTGCLYVDSDFDLQPYFA